MDFEMNGVPKMEGMETVDMEFVGSNVKVGSVDASMLTEEEKEIVRTYKNEIDLRDSRQVISYGAHAQRNISNFSVSILNKVQTRDLGDVGQSLKELTVALNATVEPEKKGIMGIFQKGKQSIESIKANYAKAETNVKQIENNLERHQVVLMQDVSIFDKMYDLNLKYYRDLTMYIIAGKQALEEARNTTLAEFHNRAVQTQDPADTQAFRDFNDLCNRFEKKLSDLELTRMISIQLGPQIRLLQNNDQELLEKIQSSLINTIPLWRNQIVLALGIEHSRRALEAQNSVTEMTNDLLMRNAETLRMGTVETARESERSIINIETLKKCNMELISTINEVVKIHEDGAKKRLAAQEELTKVELELKDALMAASRM